ncbi:MULTISPECIES: ABC transporter ATP-binding protein [Prochlorococcus]|uniref:ABC-type cobalt transport system ATPase component n=1 Tax=Prochlorococcus marinus (strain SARG / CCMP1375 / SS120) TaxID=167539 RepID=Q7VBR6_PROMA|nr:MULTISPECIES: ABC transporter ATP-binding protein [Prochlorococcus]AAQ00071.1 ABC-type cobalt transport system ATPase component [Prochlorococcus marinus subsp. marinus str. CCMP1375]KGG13868.1 putative ABC transporter [Prochlorococcus marinus str. LG]KGG19001.1 putative ABC transporter [Prochlorococcus marinus str. SS2]KGG23459.1 putative ABC transporter [Prochlorococcus marinus str. SS35]KGG32305.1 putative ABC transporter [Prochlorococcus marinus str. SS51]
MLELKDIHYHPATSETPVLKEIVILEKKLKPIIISGPSGSGKTSLIEVISGLTKPSKGLIAWKNQTLSEHQRRAISGVVFQFPERHFIGLTIAQELKLGHRRLPRVIQSEVLKKVGLDNIKMNVLPENLSGGQQRRLAIAVQLIREPKILLLDEPTAGLDWSVRDEILQLIKELSNQRLIVIVTHEPELFIEMDTYNYQLSQGTLSKIL